jgi:hypothetical protein
MRIVSRHNRGRNKFTFVADDAAQKKIRVRIPKHWWYIRVMLSLGPDTRKIEKRAEFLFFSLLRSQCAPGEEP